MLDKYRDVVKSIIGSSFIVALSAFVYIAAYYYERSYLIASGVPKEYAVAISEVRLITYISLLAVFAGVGIILVLLLFALVRSTKISTFFNDVIGSRVKGVFLSRSERSKFTNTIMVITSMYILLVIFCILASIFGNVSAQLGKPLPKIKIQGKTYSLVREYGNRIIVAEENTRGETKNIRVIYTAAIDSLEIQD